MNKLNISKNRNSEGELITMQQACALANLGSSTVRKLANDAGAVRKIGKSYRINRKVFFEYIEKIYAI